LENTIIDMKVSLIKHKDAMNLLKQLVSDGLTDADIQKALLNKFDIEWHINSIRRVRRKAIGAKKQGGYKESKSLVPPVETNALSQGTISDKEKANIYREEFKKTHFFQQLKSQCNTMEIKVYVEEYGNICCQFEDIVVTEFIQIDNFLKARILINRELVSVKQLRSEISTLSNWICQNENSEDVEILVLINNKTEQLNQTRKLLDISMGRYSNLVKSQEKIFDGLSNARKARADQMRSSGQSFYELVEEIQTNKDKKKEHARYAEYTRMAGEEASYELKKNITFPDGVKDKIILDKDIDNEE